MSVDPQADAASDRARGEPGRVRILADDLTGALDAAAPFAAAGGPLPVRWPPFAPEGTRFAQDSESRSGGEIEDLLARLPGDGLAFKKIDSLLRDSTLDEIRACIACGRFRSIVIAAAFPAQQRITRGGRQLWRQHAAEDWRPASGDLHAAAPGAALIGRGAEALRGSGVFLCDAEEEADLRAVVAAAPALEPPTLWIGTAGLARVLAGTGGSPSTPRSPLLVIIGSHHPVTLAQVEALARREPEAIVRLRPGAIVTPAVEATSARIADAGFCAFVFAFPDGTGAETAGPMFDAAFELLHRTVPPPATLLVTGGATLFRLVRALGAEALMVEGEWRPGIPISTLTGSPWHGTRVISKSGGFGNAGVLCDLFDHLGELGA